CGAVFSFVVFTYSFFFFFSSRRRHTRFSRDWSSDVCSSDLTTRTASVSSTHLNMSTISSQNAAFMALTFSGRLIATWAIRSFSSTRKAWYSVTLSSSTACAWADCQAFKSACPKRHNYNNSRPKVDAGPCDAAHALHNICARQLRQLLTLHNAIDRITRAVRMLLALQSVDVRVEPGELQSELLCEVEVIEY